MKGSTKVLVALIAPLFAYQASLRADDAATTRPAELPATELAPKKSIWLTDLSVGFKESYDDNVFESGLKSPPSVTPPAGSVLALKGVSSAITTISPKMGVDFSPLLSDQRTLKSLTLVYAPDFVEYHSASTESYDIHRVLAAVKWKDDAWSLNANEGFTYINGNKFGPTYPGDLLSAFATAADRERREQTQNRADQRGLPHVDGPLGGAFLIPRPMAVVGY
jgi:hypothetical protein